MKLLIYSHYFAPSIGGVETFAMLLATGLAQLRAPDNSAEVDLTLITQIPAGNFKDSSLPFRVVRQPATAQLKSLIRAADVIHIDGPALAPLFWSYRAHKPVAVEHHVYQAICLNGLLIHQPERSVCPGHFQAGNYRECVKCQSFEKSSSSAVVELIKGWIRNALVRRVAKNIAVTRHVQDRIDLPNSEIVYLGIPDAPSSASTEKIPADSKLRFAFVGRFVEEKGIPILIKAARFLAAENLDFDVLLIGDGPVRSQLEQHIHSANLADRVRITGFLSGGSFAETLDTVSVVVMPSLWEETAGLSAIEQMMRGRLVIASNIGGLGEIVSDAGLLFPPGDASALANAMRSVIADPSLIASLGRKARARASHHFRVDRMVQDHIRIYRKLLQSSRGQ